MSDNRLREAIVIGVDTGNKLIKTANNVFHSGVDRLAGQPALQQNDPYDIIRYNGQHYSVGYKRVPYQKDKSISEDYLILTLIAIAKELRSRNLPTNSEIVLSIGLPPGHLTNEKLKMDFREYFLKNGGTYRFRCGNNSFQLCIKDVLICPQGFCSLLTQPKELIMKSEVIIVDLGGYTADIIRLVNGAPDNNNVMSLDMGVIPMYKRISVGMETTFDRKITEQQIDDILLKKAEFFEPIQIAFVEREAMSHIDKIFGEIKELGIDLASAHVVFSGGGSLLLKSQIEKYKKNTGDHTLIPDIRANAKGYELFARTVLLNRK